jgi:hypothetical protein
MVGQTITCSYELILLTQASLALYYIQYSTVDILQLHSLEVRYKRST